MKSESRRLGIEVDVSSSTTRLAFSYGFPGCWVEKRLRDCVTSPGETSTLQIGH